MLSWTLVFLVVAVIAAVFGFGGIAASAAGIAQILFFIAEPTQISPGQQSRLSWKVSNATAVRIEGIGAVQAEGSLMVAPTASTTYTLIATSSSGATARPAQATMPSLRRGRWSTR